VQRINVQLTEAERKALRAVRTKGQHLAREVNRAHVLAGLDQGLGDAHIAQVLGVSRVAIWRTRAAYLEGGLDYALHDVARSGAPRRYRAEQEAELVALACAQPPAGRKRWTVVTLTAAVRKRPKLGQVSRETIRRWLKKTS
jgi:transposase